MHGIQLAVATGKSRKGLDRVLAQTQSRELFGATRAASETKSKPDPLMLAEILAETGMTLPIKQLWSVIHRMIWKWHCNIQMPRVGVTYGVHTGRNAEQFSTHIILHIRDDLTEFLLEHVKLRLAV